MLNFKILMLMNDSKIKLVVTNFPTVFISSKDSMCEFFTPILVVGIRQP